MKALSPTVTTKRPFSENFPYARAWGGFTEKGLLLVTPGDTLGVPAPVSRRRRGRTQTGITGCEAGRQGKTPWRIAGPVRRTRYGSRRPRLCLVTDLENG